MTKFEETSSLTRRSVLLGGGALVVSVGASVTLDTVLSIGQAFAQGTKPPLTPDQLSSYIAVNADGSVAAFFGKMDMGHGLQTAIGQMVAEELDVLLRLVGDAADLVDVLLQAIDDFGEAATAPARADARHRRAGRRHPTGLCARVQQSRNGAP